jgi:signal transduction histidine kinase
MHVIDAHNREKSTFASRLCRESLIYRLVGCRRFFGRYPFDDHVKPLRSRPLGMFFYNQRAIFMACGALYLAILIVFLLLMPHTSTMVATVNILVVFWLFDFVLTLILHKSFVSRLNEWVSALATSRHPTLFVRYFLLDSSLVFILLIVSKSMGLPLGGFASLLFANTVVYSSAYVRVTGHKQIILILLLQVAVIFIVIGTTFTAEGPRWFYILVNIVPLIGMAVITVLSLWIISDLRLEEYRVAQRRLGYLMTYEHILAVSTAKSNGDDDENGQADHSERQFRAQVAQVLKSLCSLEYPFWYRAACLWFAENHQDRKEVLLPGPCVNFDEAHSFKDGMDDVDKISYAEKPILLHSLKHHFESESPRLLQFRRDLDAPAAFVPLERNGRRIGVLAIYGEENGPPLLSEDESFLWFVGSIITNTMEQWEGRYKAIPLKEMDDLLSCNSLDEVFPKAVKILKKYLEAAGCMVIFRPDPLMNEMNVRAEDGFARSIIRKANYVVGVGQTGQCAATGRPIRWDNVPNHLEPFDPERLKILQKAHGKRIVSWMAIPIGGPEEDNYGVIKVVNSIFRCTWFTDYDQKLGEDLARRLHIMIEKFLQINRIREHAKATEDASERAQQNARNALVAQARAEEVARQRQDDLMIITHQLQGPLSSVITAITNMQRKLMREDIQDDRLKYVHALVEDALALCFGTFSTFGREAGRETYFGKTDIDAPEALKDLAERLQRTNGRRKNLTFKYKVEEGFPTLRIDGRVFTSVFYSLIHNAMKYAGPYTRVDLECSFERTTGGAALKVKSLGEPILPDEKELIFEKYKRGSVMERTGRHHSGVGLGLWVARELMRAVDGDLTLELSPNDPNLSVFVVHVPKSRD